MFAEYYRKLLSKLSNNWCLAVKDSALPQPLNTFVTRFCHQAPLILFPTVVDYTCPYQRHLTGDLVDYEGQTRKYFEAGNDYRLVCPDSYFPPVIEPTEGAVWKCSNNGGEWTTGKDCECKL